MNGIDITPLMQAVVSVAAAVIAWKVIPWIAGKTSLEQQEALRALSRTLVLAAEQVYGSGRGREKLSYVESELKKRGYRVDMAAIEASVMEMSQELIKNERKENQ